MEAHESQNFGFTTKDGTRWPIWFMEGEAPLKLEGGRLLLGYVSPTTKMQLVEQVEALLGPCRMWGKFGFKKNDAGYFKEQHHSDCDRLRGRTDACSCA